MLCIAMDFDILPLVRSSWRCSFARSAVSFIFCCIFIGFVCAQLPVGKGFSREENRTIKVHSVDRGMSGEINFDEFQREINEAERYLSKDPSTAGGGSRSSMTFEPLRRSTGSYDTGNFKVLQHLLSLFFSFYTVITVMILFLSSSLHHIKPRLIEHRMAVAKAWANMRHQRRERS